LPASWLAVCLAAGWLADWLLNLTGWLAGNFFLERTQIIFSVILYKTIMPILI